VVKILKDLMELTFGKPHPLSPLHEMERGNKGGEVEKA
jgi:hypothetical protein